MKEITLDGINYVCNVATGAARQIAEKTPLIKGVEIFLVVVAIALVILGVIIGFKKMKESNDDDDEEEDKDDNEGERYY